MGADRSVGRGGGVCPGRPHEPAAPRHEKQGDRMTETDRSAARPGWTLAVTSVAFFMIALDA
ncbi:MAG: hypothetical protein ACXV3F_03130, partial [Frankiaceae bacterium]